MPDVITATEYLEIGSYPFATPAARITDLTPLFSLPERRGGDLVIPGASGARPYARLIASTQLVLPGVVWGDRDRTGAATASPRSGLMSNLDAIATALAIPATVAGTLSATWHRASGANRTAAIHVEGFEVAAFGPGAARFRLTITIPAGRFT